MQTNYALKTALRQLVVVIASLAISMGIYRIYAWTLSNIDFTKLGSRDYLFWLTIGFIPLVAFLLAFATTYIQFMGSLNPRQIFRTSIKYARYPAIPLSCFSLLLAIVGRDSFRVFIIDQFVVWSSTYLQAFLIGLLHVGRLYLEKFNQQDHDQLFSQKSTILFLEQGLLPFEYQVGGVWRVIFCLSLALGLALLLPIADNILRVVFFIICIIFLVLGAFKTIIFLNNPKIKSVEAKIISTHTFKSSRSSRHVVRTATHEFSVNQPEFLIYIRPLNTYHLWFSAKDNTIYAYEKIIDSSSDAPQRNSPKSKKKGKRNKK
ncbi:MAG: hypothetical protein OT477_18655 [Chloroflexi bacterium]|nr:hypothetical protein [Chloroflexota bacterium]